MYKYWPIKKLKISWVKIRWPFNGKELLSWDLFVMCRLLTSLNKPWVPWKFYPFLFPSYTHPDTLTCSYRNVYLTSIHTWTHRYSSTLNKHTWRHSCMTRTNSHRVTRALCIMCTNSHGYTKSYIHLFSHELLNIYTHRVCRPWRIDFHMWVKCKLKFFCFTLHVNVHF